MNQSDDRENSGLVPKGPEHKPDWGVDGITRRRLITGSLAAAPVAVTLASRSAFGQTVCANGACKTPSAFASINASVHGPTPPNCNGRSLGYWKTHTAPTDWPAPYVPVAIVAPPTPATLFISATTGLLSQGFGTNGFVGQTMLTVVSNSGGGVDNLARHIVAALLNARAGLSVGALTETDVRNIWNQYGAVGFFSPATGVQWDITQIVCYLDSLVI